MATPGSTPSSSAADAGISRTPTPRYACTTSPDSISCAAIERTVFEGTAKPMPTLPPFSLSICELTPMTSPRRFSSGPPELPWLIGASVWMVSLIVKSFGAFIERLRALTMPAVTVCSSPNGLPIATTPSPTCTLARVGESQRLQERRRRSLDFEHREVGRRVGADDARVVGGAVRERHVDRGGAAHDVLVRDDVALAVVDPARALGELLLLAAEFVLLARGGRDLDDRLVRSLVDVVDGESAARARGRERVRDGHLAGRRRVVVDERRGHDGGRAGAEDERCDQGGDGGHWADAVHVCVSPFASCRRPHRTNGR